MLDISQGGENRQIIEISKININAQALPETLNKKLPENVADVEVGLSSYFVFLSR